MTDKDLKVKCVPMHARFSEEQCEKQRNGGRDYCVNCERGKGISSGKFRNVFNSPPRQRKIEHPSLQQPSKQAKEKPLKISKSKKPVKKRGVKPKPIKRHVDYSLLAKCPNCGHPVTGKHRFCGLCEKAHALPLEGMRKARLLEVKHLRETGQVHIGRPSGYRPTHRGWPKGTQRGDRQAA